MLLDLGQDSPVAQWKGILKHRHRKSEKNVIVDMILAALNLVNLGVGRSMSPNLSGLNNSLLLIMGPGVFACLRSAGGGEAVFC